VYRTTQPDDCATADGRNLVAVIPASASPAYQLRTGGFFHVTTLDRLHNESAPASVRITLP
jgi:hypothetical protein